MAAQNKETPTAGRKRKLKFSDKELEVLTEECCLHHEVLFGKAAMSVPDTQKNKDLAGHSEQDKCDWSLPQVPTDDPTVQGDESATFTADEAASVSAGECMTTPLVHYARDTTEETDVDTETDNLTPGPQMSVSQPHRPAGSGRRWGHQAQSTGRVSSLVTSRIRPPWNPLQIRITGDLGEEFYLRTQTSRFRIHIMGLPFHQPRWIPGSLGSEAFQQTKPASQARSQSTCRPLTFILMGLPGLEDFHIWFVAPLCGMYTTTLLGNLTLLLIILTVLSLHKPMYLLIAFLSCSDLCLSSSILPKLLSIFWTKSGEINFFSCLIQMLLIHIFASMESAILASMAFDRYVAICNPLRYSSLVTNSLIVKLVVASLSRAIALLIPLPLLAMRLPFCKRYIAHTFCEHIAVAKLSCDDITVNNLYGLATLLLTGAVDIVCIAFSYVLIFRAVLHLLHKDRIKAFSMCGAHICVMTVFYLPILCSLLMHRFQHNIPLYVHILIVNIYHLIPPIINPLIYGVKMKEIQRGAMQLFQRANITFLQGV
ncbi:olfactory receptor 52P1-like [Pleurodeles waltl]|uniref:olfactory receptor 52P1-like n=1 Tax=Pleurodeles waltl TaxID=8319 RepID=UPI003709690F